MIKPADPAELAADLVERSECAVQVAAVVADSTGILGWGWNNSGRDGLGEHAEEACLRRGINRVRASGNAVLYVASQRRRNASPVNSRPCEQCSKLIRAFGIKRVVYRSKSGVWLTEFI